MTTGVWLVATLALGRPVQLGEPYPHVDGTTYRGHRGRPVWLDRRDCAACSAEAQHQRDGPATDPPPPVDPDIKAAEQRRYPD